MIFYKTLKYGIKNWDIGPIGYIIGVCSFYFNDTRQAFYVFETLYFKRLTKHQSCARELRRAILLSSFVRPQGTKTPAMKWSPASSTRF